MVLPPNLGYSCFLFWNVPPLEFPQLPTHPFQVFAQNVIFWMRLSSAPIENHPNAPDSSYSLPSFLQHFSYFIAPTFF
jgi:hypothetical protein